MIVVDWTRAYPKLHMALWGAIALAWLILGVNSDNVPWGTDQTWLIMNAVVSGTAIGVGFRGSRDSMLVYLVAALVAGASRSVAYLADGSGGPGWVWTIITLTNVVLLGQWQRARE